MKYTLIVMLFMLCGCYSQSVSVAVPRYRVTGELDYTMTQSWEQRFIFKPAGWELPDLLLSKTSEYTVPLDFKLSK